MKKPKYCAICGERLIETIGLSYDGQTGERKRILSCLEKIKITKHNDEVFREWLSEKESFFCRKKRRSMEFVGLHTDMEL